MSINESKKNQSGKLIRVSFVFSPIFENQTFFPHKPILAFFGGYFKSQISKCHILKEMLENILGHTMSSRKCIIFLLEITH